MRDAAAGEELAGRGRGHYGHKLVHCTLLPAIERIPRHAESRGWMKSV